MHELAAAQFAALLYYRLDSEGTTNEDLLARIRGHLAAGLPVAFGFVAPQSIGTESVGATRSIPLPAPGEPAIGRHAVVAAGYDDDYVVLHPGSTVAPTTGAFTIRNSWGTDWGDEGYGRLPYDYLANGLARDWWCIVRAEWVDTGIFGSERPAA